MLRKGQPGGQSSRQFGQHIEQRAARYLKRQGLRLLTSNYQCRFGEIDLIMLTPENCLVFVEVRYRAQASFGSASESVTARKQQKLRQTAAYYLAANRSAQALSCRFDVLAVTGDSRGAGSVTWIANAFY